MAAGTLIMTAAPSRRKPEPHVTGTVAFTDIAGFTEFTARRGDRQALALLDLLDRATRAVLPDGARIVKDLGDGQLLWFPHGGGAVEACLRLVEDRFGAPWLRAGLHWGQPARRGLDLVGHAVNVAARLVDLASPGEVLVSEAVRADAGAVEGVDFEPRGRVVLRGIAEPLRVLAARRAATTPVSHDLTGLAGTPTATAVSHRFPG